jgi:hypothetical protein
MTYKKWYYNTWFIALLCALWIFIIPPIIGIVLLVKQRKADITISPEYKAEISAQENKIRALGAEINTLTTQRNAEKEKIMAEMEEPLQVKRAQLTQQLTQLTNEINSSQIQLKHLKDDLVELSDEVSLQEFGLYHPVYKFANSEQYKDRLSTIRQKQKQMIKEKRAVTFPTNFTFNDSLSKGRALVNDNVKQILRSFNNECDVLINNVKFNTVEGTRKKIEKSFEQLNKMNSRMGISLVPEYLSLKLDELNLAYEYALKKQEEKEAKKEEKARLREEAKLQKEIEEARAAAKKEQRHYEQALQTVLLQLEQNPDNPDLINKKEELQKHVEKIEGNLRDIDYREANKRAGYVYVISNIGSFGENVYKIGMTRRLEPLDRIKELGDASVPFNFDVHAMIFSDDAPALEASLHRAFEDRKLNMINTRREFFNVTLDEIKDVVKKNFDKTVEFKTVPDAEQYRETLMLKKQVSATN